MHYVERYGIDLAFESTLIAVDGAAKQATFKEKSGEVTKSFDMLHVTPPQKAPAFLAQSPIANEAGYADVDQATLQHVRYANIFGLGDGGSTPNAKTMAAARTPIGRASCRERVCQYVYISVVAGTLTK